MQSAEITLWCPSGLSARHLSVELDPSHDRCQTQSVCEEQIGRTWDSRVAANPSLYNGAKFRLAGVFFFSRLCIFLSISHHVQKPAHVGSIFLKFVLRSSFSFFYVLRPEQALSFSSKATGTSKSN
jgi:hypothetical protein